MYVSVSTSVGVCMGVTVVLVQFTAEMSHLLHTRFNLVCIRN